MNFNYGVPFGGTIGNMLSSFFHPERGYDEAQKMMEKYFNMAKGYQEPFINQGREQYGNLVNAENQLLHPETLLNDWISKYSTSPYAKQLMQTARDEGLQGASSQGLLGSSAALSNIETSGANIMNRDRQQFLQDLMQKFLSGIGVGQNLYGIGAQTAGNFGRQATDVGAGMGDLAMNRANAPGNLLSRLIQIAMQGGSMMAGGGMGGAAGGLSPAMASGMGARFASAGANPALLSAAA